MCEVGQDVGCRRVLRAADAPAVLPRGRERGGGDGDIEGESERGREGERERGREGERGRERVIKRRRERRERARVIHRVNERSHTQREREKRRTLGAADAPAALQREMGRWRATYML